MARMAQAQGECSNPPSPSVLTCSAQNPFHSFCFKKIESCRAATSMASLLSMDAPPPALALWVTWKTTGRESKVRIWNKLKNNGRTHPQHKHETTSKKQHLRDNWGTTEWHMEDTWRHLEDEFWETNGTCRRQLEGYQGTT